MRNWYKTINAQRSREDWDEPSEGGRSCPSCGGSGSVSGGPYAPRPAKCYDCMGTGYAIEFQPGEEVAIDSPEYGELTGTVDEVYEFYDGEWFYKVSIDDLMETVEVRESDMRPA